MESGQVFTGDHGVREPVREKVIEGTHGSRGILSLWNIKRCSISAKIRKSQGVVSVLKGKREWNLTYEFNEVIDGHFFKGCRQFDPG